MQLLVLTITIAPDVGTNVLGHLLMVMVVHGIVVIHRLANIAALFLLTASSPFVLSAFKPVAMVVVSFEVARVHPLIILGSLGGKLGEFGPV